MIDVEGRKRTFEKEQFEEPLEAVKGGKVHREKFETVEEREERAVKEASRKRKGKS